MQTASLVAVCHRLMQNILYKKHLSLLLRFFLSPSVFFFYKIYTCTVLLQFVTEGYTTISIYYHLSHLFIHFFSPPSYFFFLSMYGLIAPCYRLIQIIPNKNRLSLLLCFFFLPFLIVFKICSLVAVCHRWIHQNLYIKPFVALVTFFSLPFLIFFSRYTILLHFVTD